MKEGEHSGGKFPARNSLWCNVLWLASVGIVYFAAVRVSLSYLVQVEEITPIWPASGIFLSVILLSRAELRPWIIGGLCLIDLVAEITAGTPLLIAVLYAVAVSGDAALGSWLMLRFAGEGIAFKKVREVVVFLAFAVVLSNCLWGALAASASQYFQTTSYVRFWGWWVASEGMGNLLITPFLLSWAGVTILCFRQWKMKRIIEGATLFIPLTVLNYGAFYFFSDHSVFSLLHAYITFPFLLWAALRFGVRGVTAAVIILATIALYWVVTGRDAALAPDASHWHPMLLIQLYLAIITIPSFLLAAVMTERQENYALLQAEMNERKEAESALLERNRQLVTLSRASERINAVLDTPVVLRRLVASALELTAARGGAAGSLRGGKIVFTEYNNSGEVVPMHHRFAEDEGVPGWVMQTRRPYLTNDAAHDSHVVPEIRKALGFENLLDVPILDRAGALLGCFEIHNKEGGFNERDVLVLQSLAATAAIAMENARLLSERKQAEEEIREREHLLTESQTIGHIGSWAWDLRAGSVKWTEETYRIYGVSPDTFLPTLASLLNLIHPEDRPAMQQWIEECAAGKSTGELEFRTLLPDGSVRFLSGRGELIRHDNGPGYLAGTVQDITDRKQTEAAEKEARRLLRAVLDTVPVRVFWKDRESRFLGCNVPFANDAGLRKPQDIIGKTDLDLSWREQAEAYRADDRRVMETGTPKVGYEEPQTTPEGKRIWLRTSKIPLRDAEGKIVGVLATYEDITASKQAREALQTSETLLRKSQALGHIGSWELNLVTNQLTWSDEVFRIFGVAPQKFAATYEGFLDLVHPDDRQSLEAAYWCSLREQRDTYATEHRIIRKDTGEVRFVSEKCEHIKDSSGRVVRSIGMVQDITDRKKAEEFLQSQAKHLEALVQERTAELQDNIAELEAFSYTIAHDMRAPLRAILGYTQLLRQQCSPQPNQAGTQYFAHIIESARRMDRLIQDVLTLSRVARTQLKLEPVDADKVLHGILHSYPTFQPPHVKIEVEGPLPMVMANEAALTQCISNLLSNAVKFVSPGTKPQVTIWAESLPAEEGTPLESHDESSPSVRLWFADNGIGIPEDQQERIFDIFQRVETSYEGTGIGLAIVRKAMQRMGGKVGVESEPGRGSRFWLDFAQPKREQGRQLNELEARAVR